MNAQIMRFFVTAIAGENCEHSNLLAVAHFGKIIRQLRDMKGLSQGELGTMADLSLATIQSVERKDHPTIRRTNYRKLAGALGMSPEQLDAAWNNASPDSGIVVLVDESHRAALTQFAAEQNESPEVVAAKLLSEMIDKRANAVSRHDQDFVNAADRLRVAGVVPPGAKQGDTGSNRKAKRKLARAGSRAQRGSHKR